MSADDVIACWGASLHTAHCSGGEGHPHRDCYCGVYWNDDEPKSPCLECAPPAPTTVTPTCPVSPHGRPCVGGRHYCCEVAARARGEDR